MKSVLRVVGVSVLLLAGRAEASSPSPPQEFHLPSAVQTGDAADDTIYFQWYPAQNTQGERAPAIIVLHSLGGSIEVAQAYARYMAKHGISATVMELPYHYHRALPGITPEERFLSSDAKITAQTWTQAFSNVSTVLDWMVAQPGVDATRLGGMGTSLGAITLHGAMGRDARLKAGVTFVGGGDFPYIYQHSLIARLFLEKDRHAVSAQERTLLHSADPITFANQNHPRRVLMIQAARDYLIPPHSSSELWEALGRPPIRWLDIGHFGLNLAIPQASRAAFSFLNQAWADAEANGSDASRLHAPNLYAPVVKAGLISGLDSRVTPAITVQLLGFGTRPDHLAWVHADVGLTSRGPYAGIAAPVTSYIDIGIGRRLGGDQFRPYVGAQLTF